MYKYFGPKGLVSTLAIKRSAGVASEVNLKNPLHAYDNAIEVPTHAFKPKKDVTRNPKNGYQ